MRQRFRRRALVLLLALPSGCALIAGVDFGDVHLVDDAGADGQTDVQTDGAPNGDGDPFGDGAANDGNNGGDGGRNSAPNPPCAGDKCVIEISAGGDHTCALTRGGTVYCWGSNADGELGVDSAGAPSGPAVVLLAQGASHVGTGGDIGVPPQFSCATRDTGNVVCWGNNQYGQLGGGAALPADAGNFTWQPSLPDGAASGRPLEISLGRLHGCARFESAGVICWGTNNAGQLGRGSVGGAANLPAPITSSPVASIGTGAGGDHTCAITSGNGLACWGENDLKEVDPTTGATVFASPQLRTDLSGVAQITSGAKFSCAVLVDAGTSCWGTNATAQLGRPTAAGTMAGPVSFPSQQSTAQISAGFDQACAMMSDGGVWCWGRNTSGQTGQPGGQTSQLPAPVAIAQSAIMVATGNAHSCALLTDSRVQCWGANNVQQLGVADAGGPTSFTPVTVTFP